MKKFFGILFLLLIVSAGAAAYFFPGIPWYYKVKHEFALTDSIWEAYPEELSGLPEDYEVYSDLGLRITAWNDMKPVIEEDNDSAMWHNDDESHFVYIHRETLSDSYDFLDNTGITPEALERFCKEAEKTTPENTCELMRLTAMLTMDDFDIHDSKNAKTFHKLMRIKNESYLGEGYPVKYYPADGVGYRGILMTADAPDGKYANIIIYPEKDKHHRYLLELSVTDWDEILEITESIQLTE